MLMSTPQQFPGLAVVLMGVSGSGKSTIGHSLANALRCPFLDADDFHSAENKEKMRSGIPLTDADRIPWLESLRDALIDYIIRGEVVVLACSALQPSYRNILRAADYGFMLKTQGRDASKEDEKQRIEHKKVMFFLLDGSAELLESRLERRFREGAHFMPPTLLKSQMAALEISDDEGVIVVDASLQPQAIVDKIRSFLPLSRPMDL